MNARFHNPLGRCRAAPALSLLLALVLALMLAMPAWAQRGGDSATSERTAAAAPPTADADASAAAHIIPTGNLLSIVQKGGLVMYPILFCSVITLCFAFERLIGLRRGRVIPGPFVKRFMHQLRDGQLDREAALELCEKNDSIVAGVFAGALRKWGRPSVEVEQAFLDAGERAANRLRKYLRMFHAVSTICPLLGLLGTVLGVIRSFNSFTAADEMHRATMLGGGIAEALLATAAGLSVAIAALVCYWIFVSRADQLVVELDAQGQELVQLISAEALAEQAMNRGARTRKRESISQATA